MEEFKQLQCKFLFFFLRVDVSMKIEVRGDDKVKATGIGVHDKFV